MNETVKPRKLAVATMVRFAYRNVFGRLEHILELGWIMLLALLAVSILPELLIPATHGAEPSLEPRDYVQAAIALLALSAFAVRWHQSILLGDPHRQPPRLFFQAWARFLVYGCVVYAVLGAVVAAAALTLSGAVPDRPAEGAIALAALIALWLAVLATMRLALMFPAAARGQPISVGAAWRLMRGNVWRLVGASILVTLPVKLVALGLTALLIAAAMPGGAETGIDPPWGVVILAGVIETVSDIVLAALGASLLSGFYRELVQWSAADSAVKAA